MWGACRKRGYSSVFNGTIRDASSTGRCNTCIESFGWSFELQRLAGPFLELARPLSTLLTVSLLVLVGFR